MNFYQIAVLIWVVSMISAILFVRGADARVDRRIRIVERKKARIKRSAKEAPDFWVGQGEARRGEPGRGTAS